MKAFLCRFFVDFEAGVAENASVAVLMCTYHVLDNIISKSYTLEMSAMLGKVVRERKGS